MLTEVIAAQSRNHREMVGWRKLGSPSGFHFYGWECLGADCCAVKLTGCVVSRTYKSGPRKGRPVYEGVKHEVVVTSDEERAERGRYEQETGNCGECMGSGQLLKRWHHITGIEWRDCHICRGSGRLESPPSTNAVDPHVGSTRD